VSLLVHYSGYGYAPSGAPNWLADALERRPATFADIRVVTMFHELYATGLPWQRAFWTSPRQRMVAVRIARASDALMTNVDRSACWLEKVTKRPAGSVPFLSVPSNVGEPLAVVPWEQRLKRAVTFGGGLSKRFALSRFAGQTAALLRKLQIVELIDIGSSVPICRKHFIAAGIRVDQLGFCESASVSSLLLQSRIGFVDYPIEVAGKSGVVAAYAAHGICPVLRKVSHAALRGASTFPYCLLNGLSRSLQAEAACVATSTQARGWYWQHSSQEHARLTFSLCVPQSSSAPRGSLADRGGMLHTAKPTE
jgi:hypothetical protein